MTAVDRDWSAVAERLAKDSRDGFPLLPVRELKGVAGAGPEAVGRWVAVGKHGLLLDGIRGAGRGWYSTEAALVRFLAALTSGSVSAPAVTSSALRRNYEDAMRELRRIGVVA